MVTRNGNRDVVPSTRPSLESFQSDAAGLSIDFERRTNFVAEALAARKQVLDVGEAYPADEVHAYIRARIAGKTAQKPAAKPWRDDSNNTEE